MTITLYAWGTPNGRKVSVALEEMELPYTVVPINIGKREQFQPEFLRISPNNKIPAIVDPDGPDAAGGSGSSGGAPISVFESGAGA
jgi:GST-like protein